MKKILVPVAFNANSEAILRYSVELASRFQARITLLHAVGVHDMANALQHGAANTSIEDLEKAARLTLLELNSRFGTSATKVFVPFDYKVVTGFPGEVIPKVARDMGAELLVMPNLHDEDGTHPLSPVVAEALRQAPCPVLLVPTDAVFKAPNRIFFTFDFNNQLVEVLDSMRQWLRTFGSELHGVHILHETETRAIAAKQLRAADRVAKGFADFTLAEGPWREQIENLSMIEGADLLAIAPPHRTGLLEWLDFRELRLLVNEEPIPVLIFGAEN